MKFLLIVCLLLCTLKATASDEEQLLFVVAAHMKYKKEIFQPKYEFVDLENLQNHFCNRENNCSVKAGYKDGTIYLLKDFDYYQSIYNKSILVHELTHHIQWLNGKLAMTCEEWVDNEIEAYNVQEKYLIFNKIYPDVKLDRFVKRIRC